MNKHSVEHTSLNAQHNVCQTQTGLMHLQGQIQALSRSIFQLSQHHMKTKEDQYFTSVRPCENKTKQSEFSV